MKLTALFLFALTLNAQSRWMDAHAPVPEFRVWRANFDSPANRWFEVSQMAVVGTHALDFETSVRLNGRPGLCETNPLYRRGDCGFNVERGVIFKLGGSVVGSIVERYMVRRWPRSQKWLTLANFGFAAGTAPAIWGNRELRK